MLFRSTVLTLFAEGQYSMPLWFRKNKWDFEAKLYCSSLFINKEIGMVDYMNGELKAKISGASRAVMECISLTPNQFSLNEAYELMDGLTTIRPMQVQELLENCKSIKVKRLFLFFAEKAGHSWFKYIDLKKIDLGSGNRSLVRDGVFVSKYKLVVPEELV